MANSLTLTSWIATYENGVTAEHISEPAARQFAPDVARRTATYRVGDRVTVHAFGGRREGIVTKLGKSRVTVRFARNRQGTPSERAFVASEIWPAECTGCGEPMTQVEPTCPVHRESEADADLLAATDPEPEPQHASVEAIEAAIVAGERAAAAERDASWHDMRTPAERVADQAEATELARVTGLPVSVGDDAGMVRELATELDVIGEEIGAHYVAPVRVEIGDWVTFPRSAASERIPGQSEMVTAQIVGHPLAYRPGVLIVLAPGRYRGVRVLREDARLVEAPDAATLDSLGRHIPSGAGTEICPECNAEVAAGQVDQRHAAPGGDGWSIGAICTGPADRQASRATELPNTPAPGEVIGADGFAALRAEWSEWAEGDEDVDLECDDLDGPAPTPAVEVAFSETDPTTWSVPDPVRGTPYVIDNMPAGYEWREVDDSGELHLWSPDGRNLSMAVAEAAEPPPGAGFLAIALDRVAADLDDLAGEIAGRGGSPALLAPDRECPSCGSAAPGRLCIDCGVATVPQSEPADLGPCQAFAYCTNRATAMVSHPVLGEYPSCGRCADKLASLRTAR